MNWFKKSQLEATGDCFEASGRFFMDQALFPGKNKTMRLVHGEVSGQKHLKGVNFGHAWVEDGGLVIDVSNGSENTYPKGIYYEAGRINENNNFHMYDAEQFRRKILEAQHWGPWDLVTEQ